LVSSEPCLWSLNLLHIFLGGLGFELRTSRLLGGSPNLFNTQLTSGQKNGRFVQIDVCSVNFSVISRCHLSQKPAFPNCCQPPSLRSWNTASALCSCNAGTSLCHNLQCPYVPLLPQMSWTRCAPPEGKVSVGISSALHSTLTLCPCVGIR
jgi:hypothetical protein